LDLSELIVLNKNSFKNPDEIFGFAERAGLLSVSPGKTNEPGWLLRGISLPPGGDVVAGPRCPAAPGGGLVYNFRVFGFKKLGAVTGSSAWVLFLGPSSWSPLAWQSS
jgi:hypothetical protein